MSWVISGDGSENRIITDTSNGRTVCECQGQMADEYAHIIVGLHYLHEAVIKAAIMKQAEEKL